MASSVALAGGASAAAMTARGVAARPGLAPARWRADPAVRVRPLPPEVDAGRTGGRVEGIDEGRDEMVMVARAGRSA
jgi:hypothetical protein